MKTLHYNIYNNGNVGMCNILMSIENALIIAKLTDRDNIIFYQDLLIFNSQNKFIQDLFDINFNIEFRNTSELNQDIQSLLYDFYNTVFYNEEYLTEDFLNGRTNIINLNHYKHYNDIRTLNYNTLAFYSYIFYLTDNKKEIQEFIKFTIKLKFKYTDIALSILSQLSDFNCVNVRRGDYLYILGNNNSTVQVKDFLLILKKNFSREKTLLVTTDEKDKSYFEDLNTEFNNILFVKDFLQNFELDDAEKGLISLIISSYSTNFIGTMKSTFTAYIQRYRLYNGLNDDFKYLYTQFEELVLNEHGRIKEESFGFHTWNRYKLSESTKQIFFWIKEWDECYLKLKMNEQSLRIILKSLTKKECDFIINYINNNKNEEFFVGENRNRAILQWKGTILESTIKNIAKNLHIKQSLLDNNIQIFKQYKHGETKLHVDSVYEDYFGRRTSSILFYLNEDYEGSYIDLPYLGVRIKPQTGVCIMYLLLNEYNQQDKTWSHSASVITKGTKYMCYINLKEYE